MASERAQILITAIDQTKAALASVKGNLESLSAAASKVNGVLAGLGAALSLGALVAAGKAAIDTADNLSKLAQKTGISVESLSLLRPVAEQAGVSLETLAKGLQKLATNMSEAASGAKEQNEVFSQLGVAVQTTAGQLRPTEDVLMDLADAFAALPDGAQKSALAVRLFGKSGVELIPFLNQGRTGIEQLKNEFKKLGVEISGDTAKAAEKFNDTLDTVKQALGGIAMQIAQAALPGLQALADGLVEVVKQGEAIQTGLRLLGEALVAVLAVRGVAAVGALSVSVLALQALFMRFLPVLAAVAVWEMGRGILKMVEDLRAGNQAVDDLNRQREQLQQLTNAMNELASTGTLSVKTQMDLAAQAAERLKAALPGTVQALKGIQTAAGQVGEALRQSLAAETQTAVATVKQLSASYQNVAADIKSAWDGATRQIEDNYQRQANAAQKTRRSEAQVIRDSVQALVGAEQQKLAAVEAAGQQLEAAWQSAYGSAVALARTAGQDTQTIERQAIEARIALYGQLEAAYRGTVERLIAEEQRHLQAAKAADEARLNLRLSVEDRIRELSRKGMDEQAAYQDRLHQVDEKQSQARAALAAGNYEQARKLAEEAIALAERSASAVTRQVEQNGQSVTQTVVAEGQAAATAIGEIKEAAGIADAAMKGLGDAHKQAANAAGQGANEARRALASVSDELGQLRAQLLAQDKLKLDVDIDAAKTSIAKIQALTDALKLVARIEAETKEAIDSIDALKGHTDDLQLLAKVAAETSQVVKDIDKLKSDLASANIVVPATASFDQPRDQLKSFAQDAKTVLSAPTSATHTPQPELEQYRAAVLELARPTSSTHTIYVTRQYTNAQGGLIERFAAGGRSIAAGFRRMAGHITGPGTETSDSIPALLSHNEYVIRAASVRKFGEGFFAALNAGFLPPLPKFAAGGVVGNVAMMSGGQGNQARDTIDLRFNIGRARHTVQTSRDTAMQLAGALRELSRAS